MKKLNQKNLVESHSQLMAFQHLRSTKNSDQKLTPVKDLNLEGSSKICFSIGPNATIKNIKTIP
jgi:hypothetical protein